MALQPIRQIFDLESPEVVVDHVTTILGEDTPVMHNLKLVIPAGEVTVLMGPSGVGKSTLIKHIVGLLEPSGGTVLIAGRDIWELKEQQLRELRSIIGAMLGGSTLYGTSTFGSLSVRDNLLYTLKQAHVPEELREGRVAARLRELHLEQYAEHTPEKLPAHANKRLALARALVLDAPLTVLDEIDVGLDAKHSAAMVDSVRALRERTGCTLLLTTHNLSLASSLADHLAVMVNGRIVAFGPPTEVLEGVHSTDDFDRKFEFSDYQGPPELDHAAASADRDKAKAERKTMTVDPQVVVIAVVALVLVTAVFLALKLFAPGTLPF